MAHVAFISHATNDESIANAICRVLEESGCACWLARRDALPGVSYMEQIVEAIDASRLFVLVLSPAGNGSTHVAREVERAGSRNIPILTVRMNNIMPSNALAYFLSSTQWLDVSAVDMDTDLHRLAVAAHRLLESARREGAGGPPGAGAESASSFAAVPPRDVTMPIYRAEGAGATIRTRPRRSWPLIASWCIALICAIVAGVLLLRQRTGGDHPLAEIPTTQTVVSNSPPPATAPTVTPAPAPVAAPVNPQPVAAADSPVVYRSIVLQIFDPTQLDKYDQCINEIASTGANSVQIVLFLHQQYTTSTSFRFDPTMGLSPEDLKRVVEYAKLQGLDAIVKPLISIDEPGDEGWRGNIQPTSWDYWFANYQRLIKSYAKASQEAGADVFVVGSELVSTESHVQNWKDLIAQVRSVYSGKLTYQSNWDRYQKIGFWNDLDMLGMNSFWDLGSATDTNESVEQMVTAWGTVQAPLLEWERTMAKPIFLLEVGWFSKAGAAYQPWDYTKTAATDTDVQRKLYLAFFQSWQGKPELGGFSIYEWPTPGSDDGQGYSPKGKPAEQVLRDWIRQP
jgi:hypothetical protein